MLCARAAPMEGSGCAADPPAREKFLKFCKSAIDIPTKTRYTIEAVRNAAQGPVAQLDRVFDYESKGRGFESRRAHQGSSCKAASFFAFWGRKQWYLTNCMTKYSIFRHYLPLPFNFLVFLKNALGDDLQPFATQFYGLQVVKW